MPRDSDSGKPGLPPGTPSPPSVGTAAGGVGRPEPRLVARVVDPAAESALALSGPGAPASRDEDHPVKARLLARARASRGEATPEDEALLAEDRARSSPSWTLGATTSAAPVRDVTRTPLAPSVGPLFTPAHAVPLPTTQAAAPVAAPAFGEAPGVTEPGSAALVGASRTPDAPGGSVLPPNVLPPGALPPSVVPEVPPSPPLTAPALPELPPFDDAVERAPASLTPPPGSVASELDRISRRSAPDVALRSSHLSPNALAALTTLGGITLFVSLGIFLGPLSEGPPRAEAPAPVSSSAEPSASAPPEVARPVRQKVAGPWRIADDATKPGMRKVGGEIGKEPFLKRVEQAGLTKSDAYAAYGALKDILNLDRCGPKDRFTALIDRGTKSLVAFEYEKSKEEVYQARRDPSGKLVGKKLDLAVNRNQIRRAVAIGPGSLEASLGAAGFDPGLDSVLEVAFRGHLTTSELRPGDRLRIIAQEVTVLGEFSRYAGIEALELERPGKDPIRIYYFSHAKEGGYYDRTGRAPFEGGWRKPIPGAPVTSKFNPKRMHPVLKKPMPHTGTDFGAPTGTPIGATSPGEITFIGWGGPSGNLVKIKHAGGYESGYAHLSRYEQALKVGDKVERMQTVGYCGSTGRSTGPHLHFTIKKNGEYIDAESLNLDGLRVLPPSYREEFGAVLTKYDPILDAIPLPPVQAALVATAPPAAAGDLDAETSADPSMAGDAETSEPSTGSPEESFVQGDAPAAAAPAPAAPAAPAPATRAPAKGGASQVVAPSAIFLSDQELLRMQSTSHDGEVPR